MATIASLVRLGKNAVSVIAISHRPIGVVWSHRCFDLKPARKLDIEQHVLVVITCLRECSFTARIRVNVIISIGLRRTAIGHFLVIHTREINGCALRISHAMTCAFTTVDVYPRLHQLAYIAKIVKVLEI